MRRGGDAFGRGAGILVIPNEFGVGSSPTIANCRIVANTVDNIGGGLFVAYACQPGIEDCLFEQNHAADGAAENNRHFLFAEIAVRRYIADRRLRPRLPPAPADASRQGARREMMTMHRFDNWRLRFLLGALLFVTTVTMTAGPAFSQILFAQPPDQFFGLTSDTEWPNTAGQTRSSLVADEFRLSQSASICGATWWSFFGGDPERFYDINPPATETLRLRFYSDLSGLPDAVLWERTYVDLPRVKTGRRIGIFPLRDEYRYTTGFSTCFAAAADTTYWFEVVQIGDVNSIFRWESSYSDTDHATQFPIGVPWRLFGSYGMAFELNQTPEPASAVLLGLGLLASAARGATARRMIRR